MNFKLKKSSLNFRVYSVTEFPATANENDIGVVTNTPIPNWVLSPEEPSGAPRSNGDVWITYAMDGNTVNILKDNVFNIVWMSAKQYVGGAWVGVTAKSYQGGEWVDWFTYFYDAGNQYADITGGWVAQSQSDIEANAINLRHSDAASQVVTNNKVDITKFKTLYFVFFSEYSNSPGNKDLKCGVSENKDLEIYTMRTMVDRTQLLDNTEYVLSVDVSELSGEYYLKIGSHYVSAKVTKVYGV